MDVLLTFCWRGSRESKEEKKNKSGVVRNQARVFQPAVGQGGHVPVGL